MLFRNQHPYQAVPKRTTGCTGQALFSLILSQPLWQWQHASYPFVKMYIQMTMTIYYSSRVQCSKKKIYILEFTEEAEPHRLRAAKCMQRSTEAYNTRGSGQVCRILEMDGKLKHVKPTNLLFILTYRYHNTYSMSPKLNTALYCLK